MSDYNFLFKNIIIGDTNVGKSCLMLQFIEHRFKVGVDPTVGVEFGSRHLSLNGTSLKLQIWDTAGQESFKSITRSYFRGAIGALVVFDVTNRQSFVNVGNWLREIQAGASKSIAIVLVGNKTDLIEERKVAPEEAEALAREHEIPYVEASAKTGANVELAFEKVARKVLEGIKYGKINPDQEVGVKIGAKLAREEVNLNKPHHETSNNSGCC